MGAPLVHAAPVTVSGPWYLTRAACDAYARLRGWPDDEEHFERAEDELLALAPQAHERGVRDTDAQGRELYRSGKPLQLRWVVSRARRPEGELPQVLWVGQGRPPRVVWQPREITQ